MRNISSILASVLFLSLAYSLPAQAKKKIPYDAAKKECLKENPDLKGKDLRKCISQKRKS